MHTRLQHPGRQHHLGTAHPVADQAVHVLGHGLTLLAQQLAGTGQGADGHIGKGLVAQHMVGVMMGQQHFDHRLAGGGGNGLAQSLAVAFRRPAVDHHHPTVGDDERGVDDIAAVVLGEIVGAALQQPGALGDLPGLEPIVQVCPGRQAQAQQQQQNATHDGRLWSGMESGSTLRALPPRTGCRCCPAAPTGSARGPGCRSPGWGFR
ncbi:hypothetical protein D3C75_720350 [compost metagenome]